MSAARGRGGVTPRSPLVVGVALLAVATVALGAQVLRPHPRRAAVAGASGASADALFRDVARSLSPLVHSAKELAKLTSEVRSGSTPAPAVNQIAQGWETDFATSRDLVGRLPLDSGAPVERPRTLYQLGAALYVESARAVPRLVAAAGDPAARSVALKRVSRIQLLGDRLFDAGTRLLGDVGPGGAIAEKRLPTEEVPDFRAAGLDAGSTAPGPPPAAAPYGDQLAKVAPGEWVGRHRAGIAGIVAAFDRSVPWVTKPGTADDARLRSAADYLETLAGGLGGDVPDSRLAREGALDLRLAALVEAESLRTSALGHDPADIAQAQRLRLIAEQLWSLARGLLVSGRAGSASLYAVERSGLENSLLRTGGLFDGHPPPLRPGEDPGTGVPGGLPSLS